MSNYLLIHGSQHGAWCWEKTIALLKKNGHRAFAIDLPGHGADRTPRTDVGPAAYRQAVVDWVLTHDLRDLVIVGHSLAGLTLTLIAPLLTERITRLVFLAALIPLPGQKMLDFVPQPRQVFYLETAAASPDNSFLLPYESARQIFFEEISEAEARDAYTKLTPQPFRIYREPADNHKFYPLKIPCTYILCRKDRTLPEDLCREHAGRLGASPVEIDAGHDAMLSHPEALVQILLNIAPAESL